MFAILSSYSANSCAYAQLVLTFCNSMDCSPPGSVHGIFSGKNTGVACHFLLQRIFPTHGLNLLLPRLLHSQADSLPLNHLGSRQCKYLLLNTKFIRRIFWSFYNQSYNQKKKYSFFSISKLRKKTVFNI